VDGVVMPSLMGLLWSTLNIGRGTLVHFYPAAMPKADPTPTQIPCYASRTLLRMWNSFSFSLLFASGTG
jgi:NitT/TauT family transport system permease protein